MSYLVDILAEEEVPTLPELHPIFNSVFSGLKFTSTDVKGQVRVSLKPIHYLIIYLFFFNSLLCRFFTPFY